MLETKQHSSGLTLFLKAYWISFNSESRLELCSAETFWFRRQNTKIACNLMWRKPWKLRRCPRCLFLRERIWLVFRCSIITPNKHSQTVLWDGDTRKLSLFQCPSPLDGTKGRKRFKAGIEGQMILLLTCLGKPAMHSGVVMTKKGITNLSLASTRFEPKPIQQPMTVPSLSFLNRTLDVQSSKDQSRWFHSVSSNSCGFNMLVDAPASKHCWATRYAHKIKLCLMDKCFRPQNQRGSEATSHTLLAQIKLKCLNVSLPTKAIKVVHTMQQVFSTPGVGGLNSQRLCTAQGLGSRIVRHLCLLLWRTVASFQSISLKRGIPGRS